MMGPDCGTAILDGVALGFANVLRAARSAIVGASGTGIQAISCLLDAAGRRDLAGDRRRRARPGARASAG